MQLISRGEIDETFAKLGEWYPQIVQVDDNKRSPPCRSLCVLI